jgi:transcriptional regulator GlxA family with amidase domain
MNFGFVLYPGVEPIDLAAVGVLSMARRIEPALSFALVAARAEPVAFANGLRVLPDHTFETAPAFDVLLVPGGPGWTAAREDQALLDYLRSAAPPARLVTLCTGAMVAAAAGLLDGRTVTTKVEAAPGETPPIAVLAREHPVTTRHALLVDTGQVVSGGGVSLCIDTVLYVLEQELGPRKTAEIARILEYGAARQANVDRLPVVHAAAEVA